MKKYIILLFFIQCNSLPLLASRGAVYLKNLSGAVSTGLNNYVERADTSNQNKIPAAYNFNKNIIQIF